MILSNAEELLQAVRQRRPLVHHITNMVTVNACANAVLAVGGSPVMAHSELEVEEMVAGADALLLNMGTPDAASERAMLLAGRRANTLGIPVVFDPVGVGATAYRRRLAAAILDNVAVTVIRGNQAEIAALMELSTAQRGVDSVGEHDDFARVVAAAAWRWRCIVAATGRVDVISDGERTLHIGNGHPLLQEITGAGCVCSSLCATFAAVGQGRQLAAAATAVALNGMAGERAAEGLGEDQRALGRFAVAFVDGLAGITPDVFRQRLVCSEA